MANRLQDLDITRQELDNIGKALKNEEFRKLLVEYCEELTDPESRKRYEEEITQLERERGVEVTFINPQGCYVIKTSVDGNKIAFINVCTNENVNKPSSVTATKDDSKGVNWSVPHFLSPLREDLSKKGKRCNVYDVIFHPDALKHASNNTHFRNLINNIACEAVEANYGVKLDKTNLKFPKMIYKGLSRPLVIRKHSTESLEIKTEDPVDKLYADIYKKMDENSSKKSVVTEYESSSTKTKYAIPKYVIKQRTNVDIQDFTNDTTSHGTIPHELIVEVDLPLLKSADDLSLDVTEKNINLTSEKLAKYQLSLCLPYMVNEDAGNAKFNQDTKKLTIKLPVRRNLLLCDVGRDDSGVDSDNNSPTSNITDSPMVEELKIEDCKIVEETPNACEVFRTKNEPSFLDSDTHYLFPEYSCHLFNETLVFTLHIKNVDPTSLNKTHNNTKLHIKFSSVSPAFVTINYAFYIDLKTHFIDYDNLSVEVWDNNVIVQMTYQPLDNSLTSYWAGTSEHSAEEKTIQEPSILFRHLKNNSTEAEDSPDVQVDVISDENVSITLNPQTVKPNPTENPTNFAENLQEVPSQNPKTRSLSESSGEDLSVSPTKGILKLGRSRTPISRSVSESSVDDFTWSSLENSHFMSDSLIPEESEVSSSMKKTVRFNDVISRQIFRSNSSILGQKKKNQRKSRNKKRAQERRQSESENSEAEDHKEKTKKNAETVEVVSGESHNNNQEETEAITKIDFKSDLIFDIDM